MKNNRGTLIRAAREARANAHAPYSGFRVGAALMTDAGRIFSACNVENASYPASQCAEANAVAAMVAGGETDLAEIAVAGPDGRPCQPCGYCRQIIAEFGSRHTLVHFQSDEGPVSMTLGDLFPHAFRPKDSGTG